MVRVVLCSCLSVDRVEMELPSETGQQTINYKVQHVQIAVYVQYTSWWRAINVPETCRGWLTKLVEVDWWNKLRINSASCWFFLHKYIKKRGQQNISKKKKILKIKIETTFLRKFYCVPLYIFKSKKKVLFTRHNMFLIMETTR